MSSSSSNEQSSSATDMTKTILQQIYRTNFLPEPSELNYTPPPFEGPQRRIQALHNFPRVGFTNDIAAIALLGESSSEEEGSSSSSGVDTAGGKWSNFLPTNNNTNTGTALANSIEYIPPSQTSGITYNRNDAEDYIKGIAAVSILIFLIYILWGTCLILLRVGRIDCCWRWRCCRRTKKRNVKKDQQQQQLLVDGSSSNDGGAGDTLEVDKSSMRALHNGTDSNNDEEDEDEDDIPINQDCCCITCRESIRAKGGCCTRNVFCGWLAGKPPSVPTKASLKREKELRDKRLMMMKISDGGGKVKKVVGGGIESVNQSVKRVVGGGDGGGDVVVVGEAEMAVAAVASQENKGGSDNNGDDNEPQDKAIDNTTTDIVITDEYLQKRQKASRRTMLAIRIIFLISAALVIIFSIKLCFDGYRGFKGILDSVDHGLGKVSGHIDAVKTEVDEYITSNEEMARKKAEWFNRTKSQIQAGFEEKPWCPLALANGGRIDVKMSLAKLLLRGNLIKLALIDQVDEVKDQALDAVGGVVGGNGSGGGANKRNVATNMTQQVQTAVGSAVQTTENAIDTVTGAVTNKACMTVEECQKRSEELGLKFNGTGVFESHGCFSVEGEVAYFGLGTLEQIESPNVNGQETSTLHERIVCKAATAVAVNLVNNAVDSAVDAAKKKVFTVVTFLDDLQNPEGGVIQGILGKVLGLKGFLGENDAGGDNRIRMLVAKLKELVRSLIVEGTDIATEIIPGDGQRALQLQASDAVDAITETIVEKDGINYTILSLADNFTGPDLIINGYNVTKLFTTDVTVEIDVATLTQSVNKKLEDSSSFLLDIFRRLQTALEKIYQQASDAQDSLESLLPYLYVIVVFAAILIGLTSFFIVGTILAWIGKQPRLFRCANDNIILPIFILVGLLVWIFTIVFLALGVVTGDYCVVSPNVQMNKIFEQTLARISPIGYKFAYFYFNGCELADRPRLMSVAYEALIGTRVVLDQFFELVNNMGEGPLRKACGLGVDGTEGDPVNALSILANVLRIHVGGAMGAVLTVGKLVLCKEFFPIYSFLAYQVICTDFVNLLGPMFSSLFVISIFSMLMVTMRVAWHELVEDEVDGEGGSKLEDDLGTDEVAQIDAGEAVGDEGVVDAAAEEEKEDAAVAEVEAEEGN